MNCICGFQPVEVGRAQVVTFWCGCCKRVLFYCPCGGEMKQRSHTNPLEMECGKCFKQTTYYKEGLDSKPKPKTSYWKTMWENVWGV